MAELKHTPGPWEHQHCHTAIVAGNQTLARVYYGEDRSFNESKANARLIAAAPEMVELLLEILSCACSHDGGNYREIQVPYSLTESIVAVITEAAGE